MTPFFHLLFILQLFVTLISEFENTQNSCPAFGPFWSVKYLNFLARSYQFGKFIMLFQKVDTLRLLKIYIIFCPPVTAKYSLCQAPANGLNIVVQKRTLKHPSPHSNFICCLMLKVKRPSVLLDFHYNQQFNYNIKNSCRHLCCDDISKGGRKNCCAYNICEIFAWLLCMETLALNFLYSQ